MILGIFDSSFSSYAQCVCTTNFLNIGTGYNHENGTFYANGDKDQYWKIVSGPATHAPYPICAVSWGAGSGWFASPTSGAIGIGGLNSVADGNYGAGSCVGYSSPYIFEREFAICTPNGPTTTTIALSLFAADNEVRNITLQGPGGPYILSTSCFSLPGVNTISFGPLMLTSGVYKLQVAVANKWVWIPAIPVGSWSGQTTMNLHIRA